MRFMMISLARLGRAFPSSGFGQLRPAALLLGLLIGSAIGAPSALAARYDGLWSVLIITQSGDCDRAYRYPVQVQSGRVSYAGTADFTVDGRVSGGGAVRVTIRRGSQSASGSGRLGAAQGSGRWSGKSSTTSCSGIWQAERR